MPAQATEQSRRDCRNLTRICQLSYHPRGGPFESGPTPFWGVQRGGTPFEVPSTRTGFQGVTTLLRVAPLASPATGGSRGCSPCVPCNWGFKGVLPLRYLQLGVQGGAPLALPVV